MQKDYFSQHASIYAAFRPSYPKALYDFVFSKLTHFDTAWDCATGNGQVAGELCKQFKTVEATDISQQQLDKAVQAKNIRYSISPAEKTDFAEKSFDLITVAQALHWFDTDRFFAEAKRIGKAGGKVALWGYSMLTVNKEIDELFYYYYDTVVGHYWDAARKHVEEEYASIHFPFEKIQTKRFELHVEWDMNQFIGYLRSWSATQKFIKTEGYDPLLAFSDQLKKAWIGNEKKTIILPIFLKLCVL
jgi:SAM-dependent methyltransferase